MEWISFAAITLLALALRLYRIDRKSVWFDEAVSVVFASLSPPDLWRALANDSNPPLYYLLLHAWLPLARDDAWLRLPSALFSTACVSLAMLLGRQVASWRVGLLGGLFTAVAAFPIDLGQEARTYALLSCLVMASLLLLVEAERRGGLGWWAAFALVTTLARYAHNYANFLVAAEAVYLAGRMLALRRWQPRPAAALAGVALLALPGLPILLGQVELVGEDYWIAPPTLTSLQDTHFALVAYTPPWHGWGMDPFNRSLRWAILGLLVVGSVLAWRHPRQALLVVVLVLVIGLPLVVSLVRTPIYVIRYIGFIAPLFWLLVACGICALPGRTLRAGAVAAVTVALALNLPALYHDLFYTRSDIRAATALIQEQAQGDDLVVHTRAFTAYPFWYYSQGRIEAVLLPENDQATLRSLIGTRRPLWYVLDFTPMDEEAATTADEQARAYLAGATIVQQQSLPGVHVYLVRATDP